MSWLSVVLNPVFFVPPLTFSLWSRNRIGPSLTGVVAGVITVWLHGYTDIAVTPSAFDYGTGAVMGFVIGTLITWSAIYLRRQFDDNNGRLSVKRWRLKIDTRVLIATTALLLAWLVSGALATTIHTSLSEDQDTVVTSFYASWTANVLFFTVAGIVIAILGFRSAEDEAFPARVGALFSGADGNILDFYGKTIRELACCAETGHRDVFVEEYNEEADAYKVRVETCFTFKNLLKDMPCDETMPIKFGIDTFSVVPGDPIGCVELISVDGKNFLEKEGVRAINPETPFTTELTLHLESDQTTEFLVKHWIWVRANEPQSFTSRRFVNKFDLTLYNRCADRTPGVWIEGEGEAKSLLGATSLAMQTKWSIPPGEKLFEYKLLEPT